ncbi:MAG TPA: DUF397 domain-containing protein [Pseudonocardiaceae bacterium]|nr:DUF397 domain-containing protein [Pseudonocardiaceae bacterium]
MPKQDSTIRSRELGEGLRAAMERAGLNGKQTAREPDLIVWHTNSYTYGNGAQVGWRTSSYSAGSGNCVQVAPAPDRVLVRDSKDPDGPALAVPTITWRAFLRTFTP